MLPHPAPGDGPAAVARVARRPNPWWWAGAVALGSAYLLVNDPTKGHTFLPCPFKAVTGLDCPGCGATRATSSLLRGQVADALGYNVLWIAVIPLVVWAWVVEVRGGWSRSRHPFRSKAFGVGLAAVAVVFAVLRNLPWAPFSTLGT